VAKHQLGPRMEANETQFRTFRPSETRDESYLRERRWERRASHSRTSQSDSVRVFPRQGGPSILGAGHEAGAGVGHCGTQTAIDGRTSRRHYEGCPTARRSAGWVEMKTSCHCHLSSAGRYSTVLMGQVHSVDWDTATPNLDISIGTYCRTTPIKITRVDSEAVFA